MLKKYPFVWGILIFIVTIASLIFLATPIQLALGLWGVALTELILLAIALIAVLLLRYDFKTVFHVRKPRFREIGGMALMYLPALFIGAVVTMISGYFYPRGLNTVVGIQSIVTSLPLPLAWLIIAVLPAVCEEALFRGVILHTFSSVRRKLAVICAVSFMFGLFHLDPVRFGATAILGGVITYIALETGNFLLPVLYHMFNNTVSVFASQMSSQQTVADAALNMLSGPMILVMAGVYLIFCAPAIPIMRGGAALIKTPVNPDESDEERLARLSRLSNARRITVVAVILVFAAGVTLVMTNAGSMAESLGL
jgi:membrane protease YdiL (CAAX protease family)